jgi:DNA gyrase/topoisomerase IV subunit A
VPVVLCCAGGEIILTDGVRQAYEEGKGGILMRAKMHIEDGSGGTTATSSGSTDGAGAAAAKKKAKKAGGGNGKPLVVVTELPYQTNKVGETRGRWDGHEVGTGAYLNSWGSWLQMPV